MVGVAGDTAISGIDNTLFAVGTFLVSHDHAGLTRLAELAKVAVAGRAKPFGDLPGFFPAGWVAATSLLCWLDHRARRSIGILMVVAYLA